MSGNHNQTVACGMLLIIGMLVTHAVSADPPDRDANDGNDVTFLRDVISDQKEYPAYRRRACQRLRKLGPASAPAVPALLRVLEDARLAYWAAEALWNIGPDARAAARALADQSDGAGPATRQMARLAAGGEGPAAAYAAAFAAPSPDTRLWAVQMAAQDRLPAKVFQELDLPARLSSLARDDKDPRVRSAAAFAAAELAVKQGERVLLFTRVVNDGAIPALDRSLAATNLGLVGPDATFAEQALTHALRDVDRDVRHAAAWSLGQIASGGQETVAALRDCARAAAGADADLYEAAELAALAIEVRQAEAEAKAKRDARSAEILKQVQARYEQQVRDIERDVARDQADRAARFAESFRNPYSDTYEDLIRRAEYYQRQSEMSESSALFYSKRPGQAAEATEHARQAQVGKQQEKDYRRRAEERRHGDR